MTIKVLDCTLRDGGYVNNFAFGEQTAKHIITGLMETGVEYIEVGFLRNTKTETETTVYTSIDELKSLLPRRKSHSKLFAMIVYGKFDIDRLSPKSETPIDGIRITFKKKEIDEALNYIKAVQDKGYIVSANPTGVNDYSDKELLSVVEKVNQYHPDIFAIVDTLGVLKSDELMRLFYLINHNLSSDIVLAFHSHNNLQLSFSNAQALVEAGNKRELIIDSSIRGMGRGAGNLCTELLLQYLNDNYSKNYNLIPILKCVDEQINKIFAQTPWGYNLPYYLAASLQVHPNYASFLTDKASISVENMSEILSSIPDNRKSNFDENLIQNLYLKYQENEVDDNKILEKLKSDIADKKILLLAPGKTITTEREKINNYIKQNNPFVISINFRPQDIPVNNVFIGNVRRFSEMTTLKDVIVTSNIKTDKVPQLNYGSYLNNSEMPDNSALMLLKVLVKIGVKDVAFAGLDGFSNASDNYFSSDMINNAKLGEEFDKRNDIMSTMLKQLSRHIAIKNITTSLYGK